MDLELSGLHAVVTGGSSGLGLAVSRGLIAEGASVTVVARRKPPADLTAHFVACDLSLIADVEDLIGRIASDHGPVDILVNNAGVWPTTPFDELGLDQWRRTMDVNLTAPMLLSREMAKRCLAEERPGVILNVVSQAAFDGARSGHADYAAAKAGLVNLTRTMARELAGRGIRVNAIAPGMMETKMAAAALADRREHYLQRIPLGRIADPTEIADIAVFLCSTRARYMAGATVDASGGMITH